MANRVLGVGYVSKICKKFAFIASDDYDSVFFPLEADLTAPVKSTDLKKRYNDGDLVVFIAKEQPGREDCPFHALSVAKECDLQKVSTAVLDVLPDRALLSTGAGTVLLPADAVDDDGRTWGELSDGELRGFLRVGEGIVVEALVLAQAEDGCKRVAVRANRTRDRSPSIAHRPAPRPLRCPIRTQKARLCSIPSSSQRELIVGVLGLVICASDDEAFLFAKEVGLAHALLRRAGSTCDDSKESRLSAGDWLVYDVRPQAPTSRLTCIWRAEKLRRPTATADPNDVHLWFDRATRKLHAQGTALVCNKSVDGQKCYFWNDRIGRMSSARNDPECDFGDFDVRSLPVFSVVRFRAYFGGQYEDCPWNVYHLEATDLPATTNVLLTIEKAKISHLTTNNAGFISFRKQSEIFFAFMDLPDCAFVDLSIGTLVRVTAYQQNRCKTSEMRAILVTPLHPTSLSPNHRHPILDAKFRPMIDWRCEEKGTSASGRSTTSSRRYSNSQDDFIAVDDLEKELELIDFEDVLDETPAPLFAAVASTTLPSRNAEIGCFDQLADDDQLSLRESELDTPSEELDYECNFETANNGVEEIGECGARVSNDQRSSLLEERLFAYEFSSPTSSSARRSAQSDDYRDIVEELHEDEELITELSQVAEDCSSLSSGELDGDPSIERPTSASPQLLRRAAGVPFSSFSSRRQRSQFEKVDESEAPRVCSARLGCSPKAPVVAVVERCVLEVGEIASSTNIHRSRAPSRAETSDSQQHVEQLVEGYVQQHEEQLVEGHKEQQGDFRPFVTAPPPFFCYARMPPPPPMMFVRSPGFAGYTMPPSLPSHLPAFPHGPPMSPMYGQHFFAAPPPMYQLRSLDTASTTNTAMTSGAAVRSPLAFAAASTTTPSSSSDRRLLQRILRDPIIFDLIISRFPEETTHCLSLRDI
uniref:Uncharacterized protein n=1 Tax=Plectus sambesii TaxID=2011161 RepID=A0A914W3B0_9BILA